MLGAMRLVVIGILAIARASAADTFSIGGDYIAEGFVSNHGSAALGHIDASLTVDSSRWYAGGTLYVMVQNDHGSSIGDDVGSVAAVSNLEAPPFTQVGELFYEQVLGVFDVRIGKQDANRDFGTPRFGGNFLNNNFGMVPSSPLPSYPTTGWGAFARAKVDWLAVSGGVYEGAPEIGFGLERALHDDGGHTLVGGLAATRHFGPGNRDEATTSLAVWHLSPETDAIAAPAMPSNDGFFVQDDERFYAHPLDPDDPSGLTVILRFAWARPDRNQVARYAGGSAAWHGIRTDDTIGLGFGYMTVGTGDEWFVEASYKFRPSGHFSLQPDLELYRHPSGTGPDAVLAGVRAKIKL